MNNDITVYEEPTVEMTWEEQVKHVLAELSAGRAVSTILRDDPGMPKNTTFYGRVYNDDALFRKLVRAREIGADAVLEQARQIADEPIEAIEIEDTQYANGTMSRRRSVKEATAQRRLMIETRIKYAQMIQPRFSPRSARLQEEGEDSVRRSEELDDVSRATRLAALLSKVQERIETDDE